MLLPLDYSRCLDHECPQRMACARYLAALRPGVAGAVVPVTLTFRNGNECSEFIQDEDISPSE